MQFKTVNKMVESIIGAIQSSAIAVVTALQGHTFSSKVSNFPKDQKISGEVSVTNQEEVASELVKLKRILLEFQNSVVKKKLPKEIKVSNFPKPQDFDFPDAFEVSNFPKKIRIANTKDLTSVRVKNQPTAEIKDVSKEVKALAKLIKKIKLDPQINVAPAKLPKIDIPKPQVTVKKDEFDYEKFGQIIAGALFTKDPEEYLSVRLSDGEKFYEAISELVTVSSSGSSSSFADNSGNPTRAMIDSKRRVVTASEEDWSLNDVKVDSADTNISYLCQENSLGDWRVTKIIEDENDTQMRYATETNNEDITGYVDAYNNRETLTYTISSLS